jgi:predicted nucleic acid-binding protein
VSLLDDQPFNSSRLHGPRQVTDAYLLALAVQHGSRFVTFDRTVSIEAARRASQQHLVVL